MIKGPDGFTTEFFFDRHQAFPFGIFKFRLRCQKIYNYTKTYVIYYIINYLRIYKIRLNDPTAVVLGIKCDTNLEEIIEYNFLEKLNYIRKNIYHCRKKETLLFREKLTLVLSLKNSYLYKLVFFFFFF